MAKVIKVRVNTGNEESNQLFDVASGSGDKGSPTRVKVVKGARYQLEDPSAKNVGPENIRSKRVGKNLHVMLDGSNEADLIIEDYFDKEMLTENNRGLYGRAEDGKLYEYIPEDPTPEGMPINLADGGRPVSQVLGGTQIGEAFELSGLVLAAAGGGFSALTAGAAVVGGAALAGGGGGGGGAAGGNNGDDTMTGGNGNDTMDGGAGNDSMDGGNGDDSMSGGDGNDSMNGGTIGEAGGDANATPGAALTSTTSGVSALNVLTNDTDVDTGDTKAVQDIKAGTAAGAGTAVTASTTSANGQSINGAYGTLVMGADGS